MQELKQLAFSLSNTKDTKQLKKLYPKLDFRAKKSWQYVVNDLQLHNDVSDTSLTIESLRNSYESLIDEWYKIGGNDDYYLDRCHLIKVKIKELSKSNVLQFSKYR